MVSAKRLISLHSKGGRAIRAFKVELSLLSIGILVGLWGAPLALTAERPRYGGMLRVALAGDPPSLDMHQEQTFMVTIPLSPCYNTLVQFDPHDYPEIIGELVDSWTVSDDHLTYTFTLHDGVKFHDGGELTAADVKASWDKIVQEYEANLREAKRLLAEAGYPNGLKVVLTNRAVKLPYIDFAVYLIDSWKKIGVEVEHKLEESATWSKSRLTKDFELLVDPFGSSTVADPDEIMVKFTTSGSNNWGRFSDPQADKLFVEQKTTLDPEKRSQLVRAMQKEILQHAWWIPGLWWTRLEVRSARIRNYEPLPSHWQNRRLEDVWLAAK
jgi:ABC-type transport system substrate-binding protein